MELENKLPLPAKAGKKQKSKIPILSNKAKRRIEAGVERKIASKEMKLAVQPKRKRNRTKNTARVGFSDDAKLVADYAKTLVAPELGPIANRPDSAPYRDLVVSPSFSTSVASITDSVNGTEVMGIAVFPSLVNQYYTVSASANGALTWTASSNNPMYTTVSTNFTAYTPISMSCSVVEVDPLEGQNGIYYSSQIRAATSAALLPANITNLTQSPFTAVTGGVDPTEQGVRLAWMPPQSSSSFYQTPIGVQIQDAGLLVHLWVGSAPVSGATHASFTFSVHFNIEVLADENVSFLFPSKPSVGGDDTIMGRALRTALSWIDGIGASVKGFNDFMEHMSWDRVKDRIIYGPSARNIAVRSFGRGMMGSGNNSFRGATESPFVRGLRRLNALLHDLDHDYLSVVLSSAGIQASKQQLDELTAKVASKFNRLSKKLHVRLSVEGPGYGYDCLNGDEDSDSADRLRKPVLRRVPGGLTTVDEHDSEVVVIDDEDKRNLDVRYQYWSKEAPLKNGAYSKPFERTSLPPTPPLSVKSSQGHPG